jgi:hypothetical protein
VSQPSDLLACPPAAVTLTAPDGDLRFATAGGRAIVGVARSDGVRWVDTVVPAPLRLIADMQSVAYHRMWSGVLEVDLPVRDPLRIWLCDGESQVLLLTLDATGHPTLRLA